MEYRVVVSVDLKLDEVLAKRFAALTQAGITKTEIVRKALVVLLDRTPAELLQAIGLVDKLGKPELVTLDKYEYQPVPEPVAAAVEQGKK